jgi:hypothetical protein
LKEKLATLSQRQYKHRDTHQKTKKSNLLRPSDSYIFIITTMEREETSTSKIERTLPDVDIENCSQLARGIMR